MTSFVQNTKCTEFKTVQSTRQKEEEPYNYKKQLKMIKFQPFIYQYLLLDEFIKCHH